MVRLHLPQEVPARQASPTACTVPAPRLIASRIVELFTASQKQIHTSAYPGPVGAVAGGVRPSWWSPWWPAWSGGR